MIVANRRRVHQFQATPVTLLCVVRRREVGLLVIVQDVRLRYGVTRGLVSPTKPHFVSRGHGRRSLCRLRMIQQG